MMCFIHYISATRRLTDIEKTITMLQSNKYSERDVPPMVLAQRDFVKKEKEYFGDCCITWSLIIGSCLAFYALYWVTMNRIVNHV